MSEPESLRFAISQYHHIRTRRDADCRALIYRQTRLSGIGLNGDIAPSRLISARTGVKLVFQTR